MTEILYIAGIGIYYLTTLRFTGNLYKTNGKLFYLFENDDRNEFVLIIFTLLYHKQFVAKIVNAYLLKSILTCFLSSF